MKRQLVKPFRKTKASTTAEKHYRHEADGQNLLEKCPKLGLACHLDSKPKTAFDWPGLDS